jgi:hypothetical protein
MNGNNLHSGVAVLFPAQIKRDDSVNTSTILGRTSTDYPQGGNPEILAGQAIESIILHA